MIESLWDSRHRPARSPKPVRADIFVAPSFQLKPSSVPPSFHFGVASRNSIIGKSSQNMLLLTELELVWATNYKDAAPMAFDKNATTPETTQRT
jgi:hypothetical protein